MITVCGTSGALAITTTITFNVTAVGLPSGWTDLDIGSVSEAGSASYFSNVFTLTGGGASIYNTADGMHFMYQPLNGDGTIVARVLSASGTQYPQAGVMIRETLNANSTNAFMAYQPYPSPYTYFYWRPSTGASTFSTGSAISALPYWVMLVRSGSNFTGFTSPDGVNWTQVSSTTLTMATNAYIGLAVSSDNTSALATATFDNVSVSTPSAPAPSITAISPSFGNVGAQVVVTGSGFGSQGSSAVFLNDLAASVTSWSATSITISVPAAATSGPLVVCLAPSLNCSNAVNFTVTAPLPTGWLDQDVGQVNIQGTASYLNGVFTLTASGQYIYGTADDMHFAYQPLNGDGTIVARVVSASGTQYPQAGVMIRETLDADASDAFMAYQPYPSPYTYFYWRPSTGASTSSAGNAISALPYWVKLVRSGSNFSGFISPDGVNWTQIGSTQTITMASSVYVGLALSSDNTSATATANFDNVSITTP
jgi:regulation of enolase protein 1 (concanavalin A-like superfamily)